MYDVVEYGAVLDGVADDTNAIVAAAADLRAAGHGTLWFPPGSKCRVRHFPHSGYTANSRRTVLLFDEPGLDVEIRGNGTEFIFDAANRSEYAHLIFANGMGPQSRLVVDGVRFRYRHPPFVTGIVTAIVPGQYIDADLDQAPSFGDYQRVWRWQDDLWEGVVVQSPSGTWKASGTLTAPTGDTWRIDISAANTDLADLAVGDEIAIEHQVYGNNVVQAENCGDVIVRDNELYHAAGMGVRAIACRRVFVTGNRILSEPGLRVVHSTNADGIHVRGCEHVEVTDNFIQGTGDDVINVGAHLDVITETVRVDRNHGGFMRGRGFFGHGRTMSLRDNNFYRTSGLGIMVTGNGDDFAAIRSLLMTGNHLDRTNYRATGARNPAAIQVQPKSTAGGSGVASNIMVAGNAITNTNNGGIIVSTAQDVQIVGNTFSSIAQWPHAINGFNGEAIGVSGCRRVLLVGNAHVAASMGAARVVDSNDVVWGENPNIVPQ